MAGLWLLAVPIFGFTQNAYDTAYLFDQGGGIVSRWGREPLLLRFATGDSLLLDAAAKGSQVMNERGYFPYISEGRRVQGVRILFPKGTTLCVQATGWDTAHFRLRLDTLLCLNANTPKPWIYWNPLRKAKAGLFTKFTLLSLSNYEWAFEGFYRHWRGLKVLMQVRYQYNTATRTLTDYKRKQQQ